MKPDEMPWIRLVHACARSRSNDALWREFLARYGSWIKRFIMRAWAVWSSESGAFCGSLPGVVEQSDLLQNVIVRLIENWCAALKAFSGTSENEWLAYLAAITASVVRDTLRREVRQKRQACVTFDALTLPESWRRTQDRRRNQHLEIERAVLFEELKMICERMIRNLAGEHSNRDILIFRLYFVYSVSISQIAAWKEIGLSRPGVGKVIERLVHRVHDLVDEEAPHVAEPLSKRGGITRIDGLQRERKRERQGCSKRITDCRSADVLASRDEVQSVTRRVDPGTSRRVDPGHLLTAKR